jgi:uncharacterized membrane protein
MTSAIVAPLWHWIGGIAYILGLVLALWRMPWRWLRRAESFHLFAGACAALCVLWQIRASIDGAPAMHLQGATLLTLAFGWQLAVFALSLVLLLTTAVGSGDWASFGVNGAVYGILAVAVSYAIARLVERWFPRHLFVYIFVSAFFGAAITVAATSCVTTGILVDSGQMSDYQIFRNYLPASILLWFPEAFVTGGLITLAVVYRPAWVVSYEDRFFIQGR